MSDEEEEGYDKRLICFPREPSLECDTPPMPECWPEESNSTIDRICSEESFTPPPPERRALGLWDIENLGEAPPPEPPPPAPPITPPSDRPTKKYAERSGLTELEIEMQGVQPPLRPAALSRYFNRNMPEEPTPLVLEPDHPMMERFQKALKQHLLRQREKLVAEIFEFDVGTKKKTAEKENLGELLYAQQQAVFRQQKALEDCQSELERLMAEREELELKLKKKKGNWKENLEKLEEEKKRAAEMSEEVSKMNALEVQLNEWEKDMDSDLAVNQRISEKTEIDKKQLIEEKRKLDIYVLYCMTEVHKFESELSVLGAEIEVKLCEKDEVNQALYDAGADLQALIAEQKRLLNAWNNVIVTMAQRDAIYGEVAKDLAECQEAFRALTSEIESYKRSASEEMRKNEQMAIFLSRMLTELEDARYALKVLVERRFIMEKEMGLVVIMIQETEKELGMLKVEGAARDGQLSAVRVEIQKLAQRKRGLEDDILALLQEQLVNDKAAIYLNRTVKELRERSRRSEQDMVDQENKIAKKFLDVEEMRGVVARNGDILAEMTNELEEKEAGMKILEGDLKEIQLKIVHRQNDLVVIKKKIEKLVEQGGGIKVGQSPLEVKCIELERTNDEFQEKNDQLQSFWLIQQGNNVKLTHQRDDQLKEINILRKQVVIMEQRTLKTEMEIDKETKMLDDGVRSISCLQHRLEVLTATLSGRRDYKAALDKDNHFTQTVFMQTLKDSEMEQLQLQAEIKELEMQLEELAETMLDTQREMLAWEKKIKLAIETKISIRRESQATGDVGQMKLEIHRMEVRYSQLKKAQDKLITDLELCILRRDSILDGADAKEKRASKGFNTRLSFQKKLDDMRAKIRALQNDQKNVERIIKATEEGQKELQNQMNEKTEQLKQLQATSRKMDRQLEDGFLHKQQNLETLVRRQKKCKMYNQLKIGKHRLLFRCEMALENETEGVKKTNTSLCSIMENLLKDFPKHRFQIMKTFNLLRAPPS